MLEIDTLGDKDLPVTADLHRQNLRLGLFPKLGRHFLALYQKSFAQSPHGIALVARDEGEVIGALFATTSNAEHYRWVTRNLGLQLAIAGSGAMLMRPQLAFGFARTRLLRYSRGLARHAGLIPPPQPSNRVAPPLSVLSHIVTAETARRRGIGRRLIDAFRDSATARGIHRTTLVTEEGGMGTPFFERLGCALVARRKGQDGAMLREYRLILDEAGAYEAMDDDRNRSIVVRHAARRPRPVPAASAGVAVHRH